MGALDAQGLSLAVDTLGSGALLVDIFVNLAVTIQGVTQAGANAGWHIDLAPALGPLLVVFGTGFAIWLRKQERAGVPAALMFDDTAGTVGESQLERHGQTGGTDWQPFGAELATFGFVAAFFAEGYSRKAAGSSSRWK